MLHITSVKPHLNYFAEPIVQLVRQAESNFNPPVDEDMRDATVTQAKPTQTVMESNILIPNCKRSHETTEDLMKMFFKSLANADFDSIRSVADILISENGWMKHSCGTTIDWAMYLR